VARSGTETLAGDSEGKEAIFGHVAEIPQETDPFQQDLHAVLADDEHALARVDVTLERGGRPSRDGRHSCS